MSTVTVKDVQRLNKRIEDINTERTRVETRTQMLKDQILKDIQEYKKQFGVDLSAKNFSEIKRLVAEEAKKVSDAVTEEYRLKEQVVGCIESGDIDGANQLLGVVVEQEEAETESEAVESKEDVEEAGEVSGVARELSAGFTDEEEEDDPFFEEGSSEVEGNEIGGFEGMTAEAEASTIPGDAFGDFEDEDDAVEEEPEMAMEDDEEDPFGFGSMLNGGKF